MKRILVFVFLVFFLGTFVSAEYAAAADRFVNNKDGTVTDTQTGLMWADSDNGSDVNWYTAESYCKGYSGGGKSGWRMPTQDELAQLYGNGAYGSVIKRTGWYVWASETRGSELAALFLFNIGIREWAYQYYNSDTRAHPVRLGK